MEDCKTLFAELEELEANGITMELDNLVDNGIYCAREDFEARGIEQLDDGRFKVHFDVNVLNGGDLKYLVALWGLSSCCAKTPCPWCLTDSDHFGDWEAGILHRYWFYLWSHCCRCVDSILIQMLEDVLLPIMICNNSIRAFTYTCDVAPAQYATPAAAAVIYRDIKRAIKLSHSMVHSVNTPYDCPACGDHITKHGDKPPSKSQRLDWQQEHWAHKHGCCVPLSFLTWKRPSQTCCT